MSKRYNPFKPNQPVFDTVFAGRMKEITRIDDVLFQTKHNNPCHLLITGDRGIGKTSLILAANHFAKAEWKLSSSIHRHNFITIHITISSDTTLVDLAMKINKSLEKEIKKIAPTLDFLKKIWEFAKRFEVMGVKYKENIKEISQSEVVDNLIDSIIDTVKIITTSSFVLEYKLKEIKEGIVLIFDEADNACKELSIGMFLKNLSEALVRENCNKVLFVLAGLHRVNSVLRVSHPSSLRLFEEHELFALIKDEVRDVVLRGIDESNNHSAHLPPLKINDSAIDAIFEYSEGYPHFVQQVTYSAFDANTDNEITREDVSSGFFKQDGALELIGDKYYKDLYFHKINVDSYREILNIMAEKWNEWITNTEIAKKFKGKKSALNNGIHALRKRDIILTKEGRKGIYRLQWISFAFWIKNMAMKKDIETSK